MLDECMSMKYEEGDTEILPMYSDKKTAPVPIRPTTSPTYTVRRLNMGLRDDRQATNRLNNEMDKHGDNIQCDFSPLWKSHVKPEIFYF